MDLRKITADLENLHGIHDVHMLLKKDKEYIKKHEEIRNIGVFKCLKRDYVFFVTHDSSFRDPEEPIVRIIKESIVFPAVKFSDIKAKNSISASPGTKIHRYLVKRFNLKLKDEATLLIGFDE
jgi:hypothetical protein